MALTLVLMRLYQPSSELCIAEKLFEQSARGNFLDIPVEKINDRLYRTLDIHLPHKIELEQYLKERQGILFNLEYALLFSILETERVQAYILVCFLAYVVGETIGQMCNKAGLGDEPRRMFVEISKIKLVNVVLPDRAPHKENGNLDVIQKTRPFALHQ